VYMSSRRSRFSPQMLKSVRENSVVPPGLESYPPFFPALKRWAKLGCPSGAVLALGCFLYVLKLGDLDGCFWKVGGDF
jgi:hypothetical protein